MYQVKRHSTSHFVPLRGLNYHVREWGNPHSKLPPLVLAHGWMDVAASWQFMVDSLSSSFFEERRIFAADWRGFGLTTGPSTDSYWILDYLGDLDELLNQVCPEQSIDLVGHSMGGNVVMMYAGARPDRIRHLVNLEGFGMAATRPSQAPGRLGQWLDQLQSLKKGELDLKPYPDSASVAKRLMKTNKRLSQDKADWLSTHWAKPDAQGEWHILGDAAHKVINPYLYRLDEVLEIYKRIKAPTLVVEASDDSLTEWWNGKFTLEEFHERLKSVSDLKIATLQDAGHMLHHDQAEALAVLLEDFLA
jgi:pimeloyl-ACP methyl ester carboxylesterase